MASASACVTVNSTFPFELAPSSDQFTSGSDSNEPVVPPCASSTISELALLPFASTSNGWGPLLTMVTS
jgi:hypothetical protein